MTKCFLLFYEVCFIFRQNFRIILIYTDFACNCCCSTLAVSSHHNNFLDTIVTQILNDIHCFLTYRIFNTDNGCKLLINSHVQAGTLFRQVIKYNFFAFRNLALFIFKHKMIASDHHTFFFDERRNTMCYYVFHFRMHFLMLQLFLFCSCHNGFCHRMWKMFF